MEETWTPEFALEQLEELRETVGANAREYVLPKVPSRRVFNFNVSDDRDDTNPLTLSIAVEVVLPPFIKNLDVAKLAYDARVPLKYA